MKRVSGAFAGAWTGVAASLMLAAGAAGQAAPAEVAPKAEPAKAEGGGVEGSDDLQLKPVEPLDLKYSSGEGEEFQPGLQEEIRLPRRGLFNLGLLEVPIGAIVGWTDQLEKDTGLRLHFAYTMLFQHATAGAGDRTAASGDLDLMSSWTLIGRGTANQGVLVTTGEYRHQIGWENANALRGEIGTLQRTTGGFDDRGWALRDLFWLQHLFDDKLRIIVGRSDVSDLVGSHQLQGINGSFSNRAFSADSTTAYPGGHVMSGSASFRPVDWFYVTAAIANGYGRSTISDLPFLDEGKFFKVGEIGFTPTIEGFGRGRYSVLLWHMDQRDLLNQPSDRGFTIVLEQDLTDRLHVFARHGWAEDGALTGIKRSTQGGLGYTGLLGSPSNLTAAAFGYSDPRNSGRDEKVLEVFHRFQVAANQQFSVGVQAIFDPTNAPEDDVIGVFTFRLRIAF
jgi:hypothetical protein